MKILNDIMSYGEINNRKENIEVIDNYEIEEVNKQFYCGYKQKRDCFSDVYNYLTSKDPQAKVCVLYGLRRTGKTVIMRQSALSLSEEEQKKALFITCSKKSTVKNLKKILNEKIDQGFRYFFIDEITYTEDFQQIGEVLANCYVGGNNVRIVISGTESLGLYLPTKNLQYDRSLMIHTTYISYGEYSRLIKCEGIDDYIAKGSILSPDEFSNYYAVHDYIETSIVENIINSLEKSEGIERYPAALTEIYEVKELKNAIERIINKYSQDLSVKAIRKEFKSGPVEAAINNLERNERSTFDINVDQLNMNVANALGIIKNEELSVSLTEEHKDALYQFLKDMDVFVSIPILNAFTKNGSPKNLEMVSHPGMFSANIRYALSELRNTDNWLQGSTLEQRDKLIAAAFNFAMGCIIENFIIADTDNLVCGNKETNDKDIFGTDTTKWYVSKLNYKNHEADMIIIDKSAKEVYLFEIKHSKENVPEQSRHLEDQEFLDYIESNYGTIVTKAVLYNRETDLSNSIPRISAQDFLINTYNDVRGIGDSEKYSLKDTMDVLLDNGMENNKDLD